MTQILRYPIAVLVLSILVLWLSARIGVVFRKRRRADVEGEREDFGVVASASLTLLGLIIGFSFSTATSEFDQRKNLEAAEANAIGTEYVRVGFLPPADAAKVRSLLRSYLDQRILFFETRDDRQLRQINSTTSQLEDGLWSTVQAAAAAQPTPLLALTASGMNNVLDSRGFTQSVWNNRIPIVAWGLMALIAICCNILIGYGARRGAAKPGFLLVLPLVVSISFFLIADIDSPRSGIVSVHPQNLVSLSVSLQAR